MSMSPTVLDRATRRRAQVHAALGDPVRLAIVDRLTVSDRPVSELGARFGLAGSLLAHHLDVLEAAGLVDRVASSGDGRRRYVRLRRPTMSELGVSGPLRPASAALFICTRNSARSQLAAALWQARTGRRATSAGTHPAERVHRGAVAAARRAGLDLGRARPRRVTADLLRAPIVVTVCDRAYEELAPRQRWLHWSIPDPVEAAPASAFDAALEDIEQRIAAFTPKGRRHRKEHDDD